MALGRHWFLYAHRCRCANLRHREVVDHADLARDTHLVHIECFDLYSGFHPEPDRDIDQFEDDEPEGSDNNDVGRNTDAFGQELRRIAVEQACHRSGHTVPPIAVGSISKEAQSQTTPCAVNSVHCDGTDRIVDFQYAFDKERSFHDHHASHATHTH